MFQLCLAFVYFASSNVRAFEKSYETISTKCFGAKTSRCESIEVATKQSELPGCQPPTIQTFGSATLRKCLAVLYFCFARFGMGRVRKKRKGAKYNYDKNRRKEWKKSKKLPTIGWLVKKYLSTVPGCFSIKQQYNSF